MRNTRFHKNKKNKQWSSRISINNKSVHLGYFNTQEEAYEAFLNACKEFDTEDRLKEKPKGKEYHLYYYIKNKEKIKARKHKYREEHREEINLKHRLKYPERKEQISIKDKEKRDSIRKEVLYQYGNKCSCCGEHRECMLTMDHINSKGNEHRKQIGDSGSNLYKWLKRNNFPKDNFRILCWNCNCGRAKNGNVCPHETEREKLISNENLY